MNRDLTELTHEQLATEALSLAQNYFHSKILAAKAIDLRDACGNEQPSAGLARDIIKLIDDLYEARTR
jgi:hypothetical protein